MEDIRKKSYLWIWIVVIILILAGVGYLIYKNNVKASEVAKTPATTGVYHFRVLSNKKITLGQRTNNPVTTDWFVAEPVAAGSGLTVEVLDSNNKLVTQKVVWNYDDVNMGYWSDNSNNSMVSAYIKPGATSAWLGADLENGKTSINLLFSPAGYVDLNIPVMDFDFTTANIKPVNVGDGFGTSDINVGRYNNISIPGSHMLSFDLKVSFKDAINWTNFRFTTSNGMQCQIVTDKTTNKPSVYALSCPQSEGTAVGTTKAYLVALENLNTDVVSTDRKTATLKFKTDHITTEKITDNLTFRVDGVGSRIFTVNIN